MESVSAFGPAFSWLDDWGLSVSLGVPISEWVE